MNANISHFLQLNWSSHMRYIIQFSEHDLKRSIAIHNISHEVKNNFRDYFDMLYKMHGWIFFGVSVVIA